jgi:hypothetical protein
MVYSTIKQAQKFSSREEAISLLKEWGDDGGRYKIEEYFKCVEIDEEE